MQDFFAPQVEVSAVYSNRLRIHPVIGDGMRPRLREGFDFVLIKPIDRYVGEGTYLIHNGFGPELYCVENMMDGQLRLFRENQHYSDRYLSKEKFEEGVLAYVVADITVKDARYLTNL